MLAVLLMEAMLRLLGEKGYESPRVETRVEPANYGCFHPQMGFSLNPGKYCFHLAGGIQFCATHTEDSLRATSNELPDSTSREVHIYGCSLAYGYGVADSQTFAWRLQRHFPHCEVRNYGVSAYSLTQMFERMKHAYAKGRRPDLVILAYASFHDERNALLRHWRKSLTFRENDFASGSEIQVPFHRLRRRRMYQGWKKLNWEPWPLMQTSALVHTMEKSWDELEFSLIDTRIISYALMLEIQRWCSEREISLLLAGMDHNVFSLRAMDFFEKQGLRTVDLAVDDQLCGMNFLPHDPHPSALAHFLFSEKLITYIEANLF